MTEENSNINHDELWLYENPDLVKRWLEDKGKTIDLGSFAKYVEETKGMSKRNNACEAE